MVKSVRGIHIAFFRVYILGLFEIIMVAIMAVKTQVERLITREIDWMKNAAFSTLFLTASVY